MIAMATSTAVVLAASAPTSAPRARCSANSRPPTTTTSAGFREACRAAEIVFCNRGSHCSRRNAALSDRSRTSNHVAATKASSAWSSRGYSHCGVQPAFHRTSEFERGAEAVLFARLRRNQHIRRRSAPLRPRQDLGAQEPGRGLNARKAQSDIELRTRILAPEIAQPACGGLEQGREGQQRMGRLRLHRQDQPARRVLIVGDQQVGKLPHPLVHRQSARSWGNPVLAGERRDDGLDDNRLQNCCGAGIERRPRQFAELRDGARRRVGWSGLQFREQTGRRIGVPAKLGDDRLRRVHRVPSPYDVGLGRRGEFHAAIGERPRLGRSVVEDLDIGMTLVVADRAKNPSHALGRPFQPLEETAVVVKHQPGDLLGAVTRLRRERELVQVQGRHRLSGAASIHQLRELICVDASRSVGFGIVERGKRPCLRHRASPPNLTRRGFRDRSGDLRKG